MLEDWTCLAEELLGIAKNDCGGVIPGQYGEGFEVHMLSSESDILKGM